MNDQIINKNEQTDIIVAKELLDREWVSVDELTQTIFRMEEIGPGFIMKRATAQDRTSISLEAKGLLVDLLSRPKNWRVIPKVIMKQYGIGTTKMYRMLDELIEAGYVKRVQARDDSGQFSHYEYFVFGTVYAKPEYGSSEYGKPAQNNIESSRDLENEQRTGALENSQPTDGESLDTDSDDNTANRRASLSEKERMRRKILAQSKVDLSSITDHGDWNSKPISGDLPALCNEIGVVFFQHAPNTRIYRNQFDLLFEPVVWNGNTYPSPMDLYDKYPVKFVAWLKDLEQKHFNRKNGYVARTMKKVIEAVRGYYWKNVGWFEYTGDQTYLSTIRESEMHTPTESEPAPYGQNVSREKYVAPPLTKANIERIRDIYKSQFKSEEEIEEIIAQQIAERGFEDTERVP